MDNPVGSSFVLGSGQIEEGLKASRSSPRLRMLLPIHRGQEDLVQRMVNFLQPGTYIQPHQHPREHASETIVVLNGSLGFLEFDDGGEVTGTFRLGKGSLIDIEPRVWHSMVVLAPDTIIGEFKRGPFNGEDKTFADWSPGEGSEGADAYLEFMLRRFETETGED